MPQVERQLREYFDAGVERVSADDVIVRASVTADVPPRRRRALSPAWVAVGAFAMTLFVFGGAFLFLGFLEQAGVDVAGGGWRPSPGSAGTIALWPIAAIGVGGVAAFAAWALRKRSHIGMDEDEGRVELMETIEKAQVETPRTERLVTRNRWLTVGVVVLAIALLALGAWLFFGTRANSPTAAPAEVTELMDDYVAAWNAYNVDAIEALVTPDYRVHTSRGAFDHDLTSLREYLIPYLAERDWVNTYEGPWYAVGGDGEWAVSNEGVVITGSMYADSEGEQNSVMLVVERNGNLLIREHFFFGVNE